MTSHALCLAGLLLTAGAEPADPREVARTVLGRGAYQTDLPGGSGAPRPQSDPSDQAGRRPRQPSGSRGAAAGPRIPLPPAMLVWAVLAGVLLIGLLWALQQVVRSRRGAEAAPPPAHMPEPRPMRRSLNIGPLTDVEDLARQGRYGEAIHLLLLHLFAALQRRPATAPAPAHTGREVLARTRLAADAQAALGVLVGAAEHVHFGGRVAAREDYENCLGHYRRFLDSFERAP